VPGDREQPGARRRLVPAAASRSLYLSAAWTGAGTALVCAVIAIAVTAICWLPAAGAAGNASSAIRAGGLAFLAAVHGGITVDGVQAAFVPLGMTLAVAALAWRAGRGLAEAADLLEEREPARLAWAGIVQALSFGAACGVAARFATLGTSSAPVAGAAVAGTVLFAVSGGAALVRSSELADEVAARAPSWLGSAARAAAAAAAVYLAAGAALVAGSLAVHHHQVEALSADVGGGWSGAPVLLLGVLAAPNAVIAGASYLAGPGFAVGIGNGVNVATVAHGTLPAFPILGAVPSGSGASAPVWGLVVTAPLLAGAVLFGLAGRPAEPVQRWRMAGLGALGAGLLGCLLAWQGGGAIGAGRLAEFGVSPWQFGGALAGETAVVAGAGLGILTLVARFRTGAARTPRGLLSAVKVALADARGESAPRDDEDDGADQLAG
jgi:hypothetical protein